MERRDKVAASSFDPDDYFPILRRHTDCPKPVKTSQHPPQPVRPRLQSWHNVSGSMDYSNISLVATGARRGSIKTSHTNPFSGEETTNEAVVNDLIENRGRRSIEVPKRVLELAAPVKHSVYTKDLDLVDTKVKLSKLHIQWPDTGERKSKSTTRVRTTSPANCGQEFNCHTVAKAASKANGRAVPDRLKSLPSTKCQRCGKLTPKQRCVSAEKARFSTPRSQAFKGPSACKSYTVDLNLVRKFNEEQQHLLATIRDMTSARAELHGILRNQMQEYAPWAANDVEAEDGMGKAVHFQ